MIDFVDMCDVWMAMVQWQSSHMDYFSYCDTFIGDIDECSRHLVYLFV